MHSHNKYKPNNQNELVEAIIKEIYEVQGTPNNPNWEADLNCIDTSNITNMKYLFSILYRLEDFNGDISQWDVSNVKDMNRMFAYSKFNGDISQWDVSNVKDMSGMFICIKFFNQDISKWDVSNVESMSGMFCCSMFNQNINKWNVSNVVNMEHMFSKSKFNKDISNWKLNSLEYTFLMFEDSLLDYHIIANLIKNNQHFLNNKKIQNLLEIYPYKNKVILMIE